MNLPKELVLDYKIWRSGDTHIRSIVGKGPTNLLNNEGYMCCLGQFCEQAGVPREFLEGKSYPGHLSKAPRLFVKRGHMTDLAGKAVEINDNSYISTSERVVKLQKLFKSHKKTIVLKNFPKRILKRIEVLTNEENQRAN